MRARLRARWAGARAVGARRTGEALSVAAVLVAAAAVRLPTLSQPLLEEHSFRQTQTAWTALLYHEHGIDLLHPQVPVLGAPWEIPFEFPLFQALASLPMDAGLAPDTALRLTGLVTFLLTAVLLYGLIRYVAGRVAALATLVAFLASPFGLLWGRTSMIEYLATAGAVGFAWAAIAWRDRRTPLLAVLATLAFAVGMLVKVTTAVFWVVPVLAYTSRDEPSSLRGRLRERLHPVLLAVIALPVVAEQLWNRHADAIKAANPATAPLTSKALETWNFGTFHQRLDPSTWSTILDRVHLFGFPSFSVFLLPFVLIVLKAPRTRPFWLAIVLCAVLPPLVFTNLYYVHDYYLVAVSPALAALVGAAAAWVYERRSRPVGLAVAGAVGVVAVAAALDAERAYHPYTWLLVGVLAGAFLLAILARNVAASHGQKGVLGPLAVAAASPVAARLLDVRRRPRVATLLVTAVGAIVVAVGIAEERGYWKVAYQPESLPLARDVQAVTPPSDFVLTEGLDWNPAVLYYARRRGQMVPWWFPSSLVATVVARAERSDYHTLADEGNDPVLASVLGIPADPEGADLLRHWSWVAVRSAQVYSMGDSPEWVQGAPLVGTADLAAFAQADERGRRLGLGPLVVRCGSGGLALPGSAQPIWLRLSGGAPAGARLRIDPALAALPVRPVTIVRAPARRWLTCTGARTIAFSQAVEAPFGSVGTPSAGEASASAVAACFKEAGVSVSGPQPAGPGTAVYVFTRPSRAATEGFVKAPNPRIAAQLRRVFAAAGNKIKTVRSDPAAFGFYKGTLTGHESALLSKCAG